MAVPDPNALVAALLQSADDAMCIVDGAGKLAQFNRPFARLVAGAGRGSAGAGVALAELLEPWADLVERTLGGRSVTADAWLIVGGVQRYFTLSGTPVMDGGSLAGAVFAARDVTDSSRRGRDDLFELSLTRLFIDEDRPLGTTLAAALEYVCESDEWDCGIVWLAENYSELAAAAVWTHPALPHHDGVRERMAPLRFTRGQGLPGKAWEKDDIVWVPDLTDESNISRAYLTTEIGLHGAVAVPMRDGSNFLGALELFTLAVRPISEMRARSLLRIGAGLGRLVARRRVDDERRHLLHVIERKGLEWSATFDAIELPIFITSMDGVVRRMNRSGRELAGRDYSEILGRRIGHLGGREEPWTTLGACVDAMRDSGEACTAQAYHAQSDRSWDIASNSFRADDGVERAILIARETTNLMRLQTSVRRGEQLAALGELVAGVAHEVRNPIFGMQITVDTLEATLPDDSPDVTDLLVVLRRWLGRLNNLMENLLAYGRTWNVELKEGTVDEVIEQALEGCRPVAFAAKVTIRTEVTKPLPILMDANRLVHAFENLITNAIQHSGEDGAVLVTAVAEDGFVECSVRDQGPGFDPADLPRIFEPFYTRRRGGTGLGLAIVQRIVDEHGGTVRAANQNTGGAIVTLRFPVYRSQTTVGQDVKAEQ